MAGPQAQDRPAEPPPGGEQAADDRFRQLQHLLPYGGLAVSLALVLALGPHHPRSVAAAVGLSAAAALWHRFMAVPYPPPAGRQGQAIAYCAGVLLFIAGLVLLSPYFGFFGFTGYLQVALLPRWLRPPAIAVNAAAMALSQVGGIGHLHGGGAAAYAGLVVVNLLVAGAITYQGIEEDQRSRRRARMVDELAEANRKLRETMAENAGLHAQLVTQAREAGVLDERQRMAGEIHDTLAQGLTGIVTQLEAADRFDGEPLRRARHMALARRLARESLAEARRSVQALRPGPLDAAAHLPGALADLAERWTQTSGIAVRVEVTGDAVPLPPALEVVLFRTAQEGLANIAKHAGASRAGLTLSYTHEVVVLDVLDDGAGFDASAAADRAGRSEDGHGYGLTAMRQRLRQVGGALAIESAPGDGTALSASVPAVPAAPDPEPGEAPGVSAPGTDAAARENGTDPSSGPPAHAADQASGPLAHGTGPALGPPPYGRSRTEPPRALPHPAPIRPRGSSRRAPRPRNRDAPPPAAPGSWTMPCDHSPARRRRPPRRP
ncbi:Signal transduction histidine kinase [Actinacidiphila yanglinensis]|uniref:Oxygen sensor histidine kinase NreB n=2 Tax=Actinacidiphila yanglinensis TaxID=310779 RepID=A0A1H6CAE8_9ACTN|nr:Signal transduction histidine kinase [Actinacidiphila yanglinensis]